MTSYYHTDDPHHSLMESSYVKVTASPPLPSARARSSRLCILGICAMDKKTKSRPMTQILDRLRGYGEFHIVFLGDSLLLSDTPVNAWPVVDCLISFTSKGFPLHKVIDYVHLRKPFCVNDIPSQTVLLDRSKVYRILEEHKIATPRHLFVIRDKELLPNSQKDSLADGPSMDYDYLRRRSTDDEIYDPDVTDSDNSPSPKKHTFNLVEHPDYIEINGERLNKPLVEKPFDADDHNVYIYYPQNGGSRRLFRKIGNRSSRYYPKVNSLRQDGSYIYEELFLNGKDLKVYTIGPGYAHGEMRKSPVVDGVVERDPDKKELRLLTKLSEEEKQIAAQICVAFKQNICGFDIIRSKGKSYVIDVNGWSFVKGNMRYYDKCARILRKMCLGCRQGRAALLLGNSSIPAHLDLSINREEKSEDKSTSTERKIVEIPPSDDTSANSNLTETEERASVLSVLTTPVPNPINIPSPSSSIHSEFPSNVDSPAEQTTPVVPKTSFIPNCIALSPKSVLSTLSTDPASLPQNFDQPPQSNINEASNLMMDTDNNDILRALVAVFRHADRTPKQKVKLKTKHPTLLSLFRTQNEAKIPPTTSLSKASSVGIGRFTEQKYKKKEDLAKVLQLIKVMIVKEKLREKRRARLERDAESGGINLLQSLKNSDNHEEYLSTSEDDESNELTGEDVEREIEREMLEKKKKEKEKDPEYLSKLIQVQTVLERGYGGIKVQLKPKKIENGEVKQALLVCKWGGEMTHAGIGQARQYAAAFWDDMISPPAPPPMAVFQTQSSDSTSSPLQTPSNSLTSNSSSSSKFKGDFNGNQISSSENDDAIISDPHATEAQLLMDNNNTLDQANRVRYQKMLTDIRQIQVKQNTKQDEKSSESVATVNASKGESTSNPDSTPLQKATQSQHHSIADSIKSSFSRLLKTFGSTSSAKLNTSVSDTALASAVVNPLMQRELDKYKEKYSMFEKQRWQFIQGMKVYSSDEARVVASARAFYMSTSEHAQGLSETSCYPSNSIMSSGGNAKKSKEIDRMMADIRKKADTSIQHDKTVLAYLDDTSMCAEAMARAKEGVKFLLMAENAWTPAQVTRHMLAVEQIARATTEKERRQIEEEEELQLRKAKEEAEIREKDERVKAEQKLMQQVEQEAQEQLLDELAQNEVDFLNLTPEQQNEHRMKQVEKKQQKLKKRPAPLDINSAATGENTTTGIITPTSPPAVSPPPSPSTFHPTSMTAWGVRCLRWIGKPRDTLQHLYSLMKQLQMQIHSKCEWAQKELEVQLKEEKTKLEVAAAAAADAETNPTNDVTTRPRRGSFSQPKNQPSSDVFEYVFEVGDEEIVGSKHKIKKGPTRRFPIDHLLCHNETLLLLKNRYDRLISDFYNAKSRSFDPTKIPDVYDCIKYDVLHNSEFLTDVRPLYTAIKRVADFVVPQEYGVLRKDRWSIGVGIARPLLKRVVQNLEAGFEACPPNRVSLYFSSESHIHALRNVLLLCGISENRTLATALDGIELNYLSHAVFRLYEDISKPLTNPLRFYVSVQFSPGAALDPFIFTEPGHTLPVSRPVPVHGRIPWSAFKTLFLNLNDQEPPAIKPYLHD